MLRHRTTIRKLAAYLLVVWFFALGAGLAQACVLASRVAAFDHVPEVSMAAAVNPHAESDHGSGSSGDVGKATCTKFCAEVKAVASLLQPAGDQLASALPVSMTLRVRDEPLVAASTSARARWQPDRPHVPISIAYLRLAL